MQRAYAVAAVFTPGKPQPPARDEAYKRWIRLQPSVVSGRYGCDCCHTGSHGTSQKASDYSCIPLTRAEHREFDKAPRRYAEEHGLDVAATVAELNRVYELRQLRRPVGSERMREEKRRMA